MRGFLPFISKWQQGKFGKDCSVIKANEFFNMEAYNSLVESLYDMVSQGVAAREVFNPATPGVSGRIFTLNTTTETGLGYDHNMKDTYMLTEKISTEYNQHIKMRHVSRTYDTTDESIDPTYNNPDPVYMSYGFGDVSMVNPYAFAALDVSEGNEQYLTIEYIKDSDARRYASSLQLILQYIPDDNFSDKIELVVGDEFNESTSEGDFTRYTRYIVRFGNEITVPQLMSVLNLYTEDSEAVFEAEIHGGVSPDLIKVKDVFYYYDGYELVSSVKVLRFVPPMPSVVVNNPEGFFNKYFNTTGESDYNMNILAFTTDGGSIPETFINTGTYGFVIRRNYDDAGFQTYPTLVTYDDNPALLYIPNKKQREHYTKSGTGTPMWFANGNPVLDNNHISSIDLDGNYFFLPFVEVTDCSVRFLSGRSIHIDNIGDNDLVNISIPGDYLPILLASKVRFDANDYTLEELEALENVFNQIKIFLGYAASDDFTDDESTLLRVTEFTRGIMWYLNNFVMIDGALASNHPGLKMFKSLTAAYSAGALKKGITVITITGRATPGNRSEPVDRSRFEPQVLPVDLQEGMKFIVLEPAAATTTKTVVDAGFTLEGASYGSILYTVASGPTSGDTLLRNQDMSEASVVNLCALAAFDEDSMIFKGCKFPVLHIYRNNTDDENVNVWETKLVIDSSNEVYELILDSEADMPFTKLDIWYTYYSVELSGDKAVMEAQIGAPCISTYQRKTGVRYLDVPEGNSTYDAALYDHPCVLGLLVYTDYVKETTASVPSLTLATYGASSKNSVEFTPISQVFTMTASGTATYASAGYSDHITRVYGEVVLDQIRSDGKFNLDLKYIFRDFDFGNHPLEQRTRSGFNSLINVYNEVRDSEFLVSIMDTGYTHSSYGDWHCFDPDVFLKAASGNDFANKFLFIDCGVDIQLNDEVISIGYTMAVVPIENRGGRFINTKLRVKIEVGSAIDSYYSVRFFASRLLRKTPYIFYLADQHPYYSKTGLSRKVSEDLQIVFETPGIPVSTYSEVESTLPASIAVKNSWATNLSSPGSSYPRVNDVSYPGLTGNNSFNWLGCKSFIAGMAGGKIRVDAIRMTPAQRQFFSLHAYSNSGLAVLEDVRGCRVDIGQLNTTFPLNGAIDEGLTALGSWVETERGFQLMTISQKDNPALNLGTKIKVGSWINRAEVTGITGGRDLKVDIGYSFYTQANDSYISDTGNMLYTTGYVYQLPAKPWFSILGVSDSEISYKPSVAFNAVGIASPSNMRTILENVQEDADPSDPTSATTPTFFPSKLDGSTSSDTTNRLRPVRFLIGGLVDHSEPSEGSQTTYLMESNGNTLKVHCTRLNLISGYYNTGSGFCYYPTIEAAADPILGVPVPLTYPVHITRFLAPDTMWYPTSTYTEDTLDYLKTGCNVIAPLAYDRADREASDTFFNTPVVTTIATDLRPKHERMELVRDLVGSLNPCDLRVISVRPAKASSGGGCLDLIISCFTPPSDQL